jgi:hypothetical protein
MRVTKETTMLKTVLLGAVAAALAAVLVLPSKLDAYGACRTTSYSRGGYGGGYSGSRTTTYTGSGGGSATRTSTYSGSGGYGGGYSGSRTTTVSGSSSGGVNPYVRESQSNYAGTVGTGYMAGEYHQVGGYGYVR